MVFGHNCAMIKDESNTKCEVICPVLNNSAWFSYEEKACNSKIRFSMQPLQNPPYVAALVCDCTILLQIQYYSGASF
jgi:hypothetical protein